MTCRMMPASCSIVWILIWMDAAVDDQGRRFPRTPDLVLGLMDVTLLLLVICTVPFDSNLPPGFLLVFALADDLP